MNYKERYRKYFGYALDDIVLCEVCGRPFESIHHVISRSKFGKKRKAEQDRIDNLIALCEDCHHRVHFQDVNFMTCKIKEIIKNR